MSCATSRRCFLLLVVCEIWMEIVKRERMSRVRFQVRILVYLQSAKSIRVFFTKNRRLMYSSWSIKNVIAQRLKGVTFFLFLISRNLSLFYIAWFFSPSYSSWCHLVLEQNIKGEEKAKTTTPCLGKTFGLQNASEESWRFKPILISLHYP